MKRSSGGRSTVSVRRAFAAAGIGVLVYISALALSGSAAERLVSSVAENDKLMSAVIMFETNGIFEAVAFDTAAESADAVFITESPPADEEEIVSSEPVSELTSLNIFSEQLSADCMEIKNYTDYDIDYTGLLNAPLSLSFASGEPAVLVIHTHSSEAYAFDEGDSYIESDPSRTEDKSHNMIRVGDELCSELESLGITCLHDREIYDYPSYTGSYSRSLESTERWLGEYPSIQIIIDLHRDAIENEDGTYYRTVADVGGTQCAQVMIVVGTDYSLEHQNWQENMKLALKLQYAMDAISPTLARPLNVSAYRYNQDLAPGSLLVDVGTNANTLSESLEAVRIFARSVAEVVESGG